MMARRILVVIHSLGGGGAERTLAELSGGWIEQGKQVAVVTLSDRQTDVYDLNPNVQRLTLGMAGQSDSVLRGLFANVKRILALRKLIRGMKPDVVIGFMTTSSILAILATRGLHCVCIATEHTHPPFQSLSGLWFNLRRMTYPRADAVVALAHGTAQWLKFHMPAARLRVIPNPVSWPLTHGEPRVVPVPKSAGRKRLLAVGRLHREKGFDLLIEAFRQIANDCRSWDLFVLGEGQERQVLQQQIDAAGLAERIALFGRVGNVADWYQSADLYVLSSRVEGLSNTLLEAMACGLPVVAVDCDTGPRDIIEHNVDGLLVTPSGDAGALARALCDAMRDDPLRSRLGARAIAVRDRFSLAGILKRWDQLFNEAG